MAKNECKDLFPQTARKRQTNPGKRQTGSIDQRAFLQGALSSAAALAWPADAGAGDDLAAIRVEIEKRLDEAKKAEELFSEWGKH